MALIEEALNALDSAIDQAVENNDHEVELSLRDLRREIRVAAGLKRIAPPTEVITDEEREQLARELPEALLARCIQERVLKAAA